MKTIGNIAHLSFDELIQCSINEDTIKKGLYRNRQDKVQSWQHVKEGRKVYVAFDSLSNSHKKAIRAHFGDPYEYIRNQQTKAQSERQANAFNITPDPTTYNYFISKDIPEHIAHDYTRACAWLAHLTSITNSGIKRLGFTKKDDFLKAALERIEQEYPRGLRVSGMAYLRKAMTAYKKYGADSVISGRMNNNNARKLSDEQVAAIKYIASQHNQYSIGQIYDQYLVHCNKFDWQPVSDERVRQIIDENRQEIDYLRFGEDYHYNKYVRKRRRRRPMADQMWTIDGSPTQLFEMCPDGEVRATTVYMFVIADAASEKILGYDLALTEDNESVFRALKMACHRTGAMPYQLQYDQGSAIMGKNIQQIRDKIAKWNIANRAYKSSGRYIERIFGTIQDQVFRYNDNFRGGNPDTKDPRFTPNQDWIKQNKHLIPDREGNIRATHEAIAFWNARKERKSGKSPNEKYAANQDPNRRIYDQFAFLNDFYCLKQDKIYQPHGIEIQETRKQKNHNTGRIEHQVIKHHFTVEDIEGWDATYVRSKFDVYYDPDNLSQVYLYQNGRFIAVAYRWEDIPAALADYKDGEGARVQDHIAKQKDQEQHIRDAASATAEKAQAIGVQKLGYKNVHKDEWNEAEQELAHLDRLGYPTGKPGKLTDKEDEDSGSLYEVEESGKPLDQSNEDE